MIRNSISWARIFKAVLGTGMVIGAGGLIAGPAAAGQFTTLYGFTSESSGTNADGSTIDGPVVFDSKGNLYGTASLGGSYGHGTIFKIVPGSAIGPDPVPATETTLYSFSASGTTDGEDPLSGVILGKDGSLYGMANYGGANGYGTIFKLTLPSSGSPVFTSLYSFISTDPSVAQFHFVQASDTDGTLYGTGEEHGAIGYGAVFKFDPVTLDFTDVYDFTDGNDGAYPEGMLAIGSDGSLYGSASAGGVNFDGTVFRLTPSGSTFSFSAIYTFDDGSDGLIPTGSIAIGSDGSLYGTADVGGTGGGGVVYKLTPDTHANTGFDFSSIHEFGAYSGSPDGRGPNNGLTMGSDGSFYGACTAGGSNDGGTIYKCTPAGGFTVLYTFPKPVVPSEPSGKPSTVSPNAIFGNDPRAPLTILNDTIYGTTAYGGANFDGSVFELPTSNPPPSILWQNSNTGDVYLWNLSYGGSGYQLASYKKVTNVANTSWRIAAVDDVNADGVPDLIWENSNTGDVYDWIMQEDPVNGYSPASGYYYNYVDTVVNTQWQVLGAADIDGSSVPDLIWQNTATGDAYDWMMSEGPYALTSYSEITPYVGSNRYQIQAIADINHDNVPDLIWRDTVTGAIYLWYMGYNGTTYSMSSLTTVSSGVSTTWKIVGCADINGDDVPDLLWQNTKTGQVIFWLMAYNPSTGAYTMSSYGVITTLPLAWHAVGFGL